MRYAIAYVLKKCKMVSRLGSLEMKLLLAIIVLISTRLLFAGGGLTSVECSGKSTNITASRADAGDSDFTINTQEGTQRYSNYSSDLENKKPATSVFVFDTKKGVVVVVGLNIYDGSTFQAAELVSISSTYKEGEKRNRGPADATFDATFAGNSSQWNRIPVSCKLKYSL